MTSPLLYRARYENATLPAKVAMSVHSLNTSVYTVLAKRAVQVSLISAVLIAGEVSMVSHHKVGAMVSGKITAMQNDFQKEEKKPDVKETKVSEMSVKLQERIHNDPEMASILVTHLSKKWKLNENDAQWLVQAAVKHGERTGKDGALLLAVALQESGGKHKKGDEITTSAAGAKGIMQVMPQIHDDKFDRVVKKTGKSKDSRDVNFHVGSEILVEYIDKSGKNIDTALKRYNGSVNHPYGDTYVNGVFQKMNEIETVLRQTRDHAGPSHG